MHPVFVIPQTAVEAPATKHAYRDAHAAGAIDFFTLHGIEDRFTGVFFSPHAGQTGRAGLQGHHARVLFAGNTRRRGAVGKAVGAKVVALRIGDHSVVRIAGTDHTHFVRVVSTSLL
ncbi:hypothetical protein D9M69_593460 [compost metagenome]